MRGAGRQYMAAWFAVVLLGSSAAILTRFCDLPASSIGFWRVFGAALALSPWWLSSLLRNRPARLFSRGALLCGFFLGLHFASWCWALLHTTVANATILIGMQPAITPFLGRFLIGERLGFKEYAGTVLACVGMLWIVGGQAAFDPAQIPGSAMALFSMVCCAVYLVMGRKYRVREEALLFSVPVFVTAAAVQALLAWVFDGEVFMNLAPRTFWSVVGLVLLPTVGGHTLSMYLLRHMKSHTVTLAIPAQFVAASVAAVFLLREIPDVWFYPGAVLVLSGVALAVLHGGRAAPGIGKTET